MADSKVLGFVRKIFDRDNFNVSGHDRPKYAQRNKSTSHNPNSGYGSLYSQGMNYGSDNADNLQEDLLTRYADYEDMDEIPELSTSLDIVSDDSTQSDHLTGKIVHIDAEDESISEALDDCFHKNINIDEQIWEIARTTCKYGNNFEEHVITENDGLVGINFLAPPQTRRIDEEDGSLIGFINDKSGQFAVNDQEFLSRLNNRDENDRKYAESDRQVNVYEDWEVTHFRLRSKHRGSQYGWSFLEAARWTVKRLTMLEDAAILYKLTRAPQRFVFNVDVGDLPPNEALRYLTKVKNEIKKEKIVNPNTNKLDLAANAMSNDEDFFIPTRKDNPAMTVDSVGGFDTAFYMDDLEYFKDKLYSAIKIPKDYLNYSEDSVSKANLSTEDMRFARTIIRIQRELRTGLINMGRVHLAAIGKDPDLVDFDIYLTPPSSIFEMAMMEVRQAQLDIAETYRAFVDDYWIMTNILKFSDEEIAEINKRQLAQKQAENPFGEYRFPNVESRILQKGNRGRKMNKEVKIILDDLGEAAFTNDKIGMARLNELKGLAGDIKTLLAKKK